MTGISAQENVGFQKPLKNNLPGAKLVLPLLLVLAVLLAYAPMFQKTDFVLDDAKNLVTNPYLSEITGPNIAHFWSTPHIRLYIPVTYTAWSLLSLLAGDPPPDTPAEARVLHIANILIQAVNTLLIFLLLQRCGASAWAAFCGALVFGIHPLQAEAVCWMTELKTLLAGLFSFSAMLAFLNSAVTEKKNTALRLYLASLVLLLLGILSKPLAVCCLPLLFVLATVFLHISPPRALKLLVPHGLLCLGVVLITMQAQPLPFFFEAPSPFWRLPVALDAAGFYLAKLFIPVHLAIDYARSPSAVIQGFPGNGYWTLPLLAGFGLLLVKHKRGVLLACLAIFLLGILPVSGIAPFSYQFISTVADRYAYFAMLGPALAVALLLPSRPPAILLGATTLAALFLLVLTFQQAGLWKQEHSLGKQAVTFYPSGIFGLVAYADATPPSARTLELLRTHLAAHPLDPYNSGIYARHLTLLRKHTDRHANAGAAADYFLQGVRLAQKGNKRDAWTQFIQAVLVDPDDALSWNNLGCLLKVEGYGSASRYCMLRAFALSPDNPFIANNMGLTLFHAGERQKGVQLLQQAVQNSGPHVHKTIVANLANAVRAIKTRDKSMPNLIYTPVLQRPEKENG